MLKHRHDPNFYINFLLCYLAKLKKGVDVIYTITLHQWVPNKEKATSRYFWVFFLLSWEQFVSHPPPLSLLSVICMPYWWGQISEQTILHLCVSCIDLCLLSQVNFLSTHFRFLFSCSFFFSPLLSQQKSLLGLWLLRLLCDWTFGEKGEGLYQDRETC